MIASLRGIVLSRDQGLVVEVGGLGLAVHVSARTAARLPSVGERVALHTYLHVREEQLALYGFAAEEERALFLQLLGVNGIGPRVALTLLSSAPHDELLRALRDGDEAFLVRLPGVGKKTAARLVLELQGKLPARTAEPAARLADPVAEEAVLALVSLGVPQRSARDAVEKAIARGMGASPRVEEIVKAALQSSARSAP
jgi:Holliday junction DNA helicase RuvA